MPYVETMQAMVAHFANFVGPRKPVASNAPAPGTSKQWICFDNERPWMGGYEYPFEPWDRFGGGYNPL